MANILITGATGNVGLEVIKSLQEIAHQHHIFAGLRDVNKDEPTIHSFNVKSVSFDFMKIGSYTEVLKNCDYLFLLRPPQISDVETYFKPIIEACKSQGVKHIVFLSVQGVEKSKIIPHHKIEKLIVASGVPYTFLRPAYFMQNFNTTLRNDLIKKKEIFLPAGSAKFTVIDVRDIGKVAAQVLLNPLEHMNACYELTNQEKLSFLEMSNVLSKCLGSPIKYTSPNLLRFFIAKKKEGLPTMLILVMIMLHYLPRFQVEPLITNWVEKITKHKAKTFEEFANEYKALLIN